jgi:tRNA(Ile)-lysidine synthase
VTLDVAGLPAVLVHRLVARAIGHLAPAARPRGVEITRLVARLAGGGIATLAGVKARGGAQWRFTLAPPRRQIG